MVTIRNTLTIDALRYQNPGAGKAWENELFFFWEAWIDEVWEDQL